MNVFGFVVTSAKRLAEIEERLDAVSHTASTAASVAAGAAASVAELETDFTVLGDTVTERLDSMAHTASQALGTANAVSLQVNELDSAVSSIAHPVMFGSVADLRSLPNEQVPADTLFVVLDTVENIEALHTDAPNVNAKFGMTFIAGYDDGATA